MLPVDKAVNAVVPYARAKLSLRVHPEQDAGGGAGRADPPPREACVRSGSTLDRARRRDGNGFAADTSGPAYEAARDALASAWGGETVTFASPAARSRS